ncbi:MAG: hypothetical protein ACREVI_02940 [Steroidobacteraceae bacterium]
MRSGRLKLLAAALAACAGPGVIGDALAQGAVSVSVGEVRFEGLEIEDLNLDWKPAGGGGHATVRAARIRGLAATGPLAGFTLDCPAVEINGDAIECARGRLRGRFGTLGGQDTAFSARRSPDGALSMHFESLALAGGRSAVDLDVAGSIWKLDATAEDADLGALSVAAKPWLAMPDGFSVAGRVSGRAKASGRGDELGSASADLAIGQLDFADAAGTLAGEKLAGTLRARLTRDARGDFASDGRLELSGGQAYSDPVFLDFGVHRMDIDFKGTLAGDGSAFEADEFRVLHAGVGEISGEATLDLAGESLLRDGRFSIANLELAGAMAAYVQPFLIDSAFKDVTGAGSVNGEVEFAGGWPSRIALSLADVTLDSQTGALSVNGLGGRLNWFSDAERSELAGEIDDAAFQSGISWQAATLWGLEIGAADLPFTASGRHFRLLGPLTLPIFDGGLEIGTFRIRHAGTEQMYVRFDAGIRPISVARLSRAFGWPEFDGTLAGSIPDLQMRQGVVTLGGNLEAAVFDGRVVVRDLSLSEPLGKFPRLHASIDIDNLDLEMVTRTFSFGMITGRLSGSIEKLETFDWMPEAFDARLQTPAGDRSRRRISQRAVTSLSSIGGGSGGGVAAALQGGFLKFFDDFGYDRLGLSCRLANDVCMMGGVEPVGSGYYIVKGKGLPRIDVIGSQKRVAWTTLVRQLGAVMESEIVVE